VKSADGEWGGPTGFYRTDMRGLPAPEGAITIAPIHVWADPIYSEDVMSFALAPNTIHVPPANRRYRLTLTYVPPGIVGAPPVGTHWALSPTKEFKVDLPVYRTEDGTQGYQFALSVSPEVPPCDGQLPADANCDGAVTIDDVDLFVAALGGEEAWRIAIGGPVACRYLCVNDPNGDGTVDFNDIDAFLAGLAGTGS